MKELITGVIKSGKTKKSQKQALNKKKKQIAKIAIISILIVAFFSGSAVLIANAKEAREAAEEKQKKEEQQKMTEIICKELSEEIPNSSVANPELNEKIDELKQRELCKQMFPEEFAEEIQKDLEKEQLKKEVAEIITGTPMEPMIDAISEQDRIVAAFLVGIALKESGLGRRVPVDVNGNDCYNYWGFRSRTERMGTGGHSCFNSPEEAIKIVGRRIHELAVEYNRNTPQKMLVWKCGSSCATHSPASVSKWVSDVSIYFNRLNSSQNQNG